MEDVHPHSLKSTAETLFGRKMLGILLASLNQKGLTEPWAPGRGRFPQRPELCVQRAHVLPGATVVPCKKHGRKATSQTPKITKPNQTRNRLGKREQAQNGRGDA